MEDESRNMSEPVLEKRGGKHFVRWGERELGPFLHEKNDVIMTGDFKVVMGFIERAGEKPRRCVIYIWLAEQNKRVFFSANSGEIIEDAIEVINAEDTDQGVAAEHLYVKALFDERKISYEWTGQRLIRRGKRHYDQLLWQTADGKKGSIFFDITGFFGRFAREIEEILGKPEEE